jgi:hypothetical protein
MTGVAEMKAGEETTLVVLPFNVCGRSPQFHKVEAGTTIYPI